MQKIRKEVVLLLGVSALLLIYVSGFSQLVLGFILLFHLPGYALTMALFPGRQIRALEKVSLSVGLSISLCVICVFTSNYFLRIPITSETVTVEILSLSGVFIVIYLLRGTRSGSGNKGGVAPGGYTKDPTTSRKYLLYSSAVILVLVFTFTLVYSAHRDYSYPFHKDEWQHIAHGVQILEDKAIVPIFPYYKERPPHRNLEIGCHVFLAAFSLLTGTDPVLFYKFLPAIFACISSFILFAFVYRLTDSLPAGLFSMLFFASLKSNIFVLGLWFFVPLTMCFPLVYLVFHFLTDGLREGSIPLMFSATVALLASALIHPSVASFMYMSITLYLAALIFYFLIILVLYLILRRESFREEFTLLLRFPVQRVIGVSMVFLIPFLSFLYFLKFLWRGSLGETLRYFITDFMIFGRLLDVRELYEPLFLLDFYGFVGVSLAVVGIFYVFMKKRGVVLVSGVFVALALMALYQVRGFTFLIFYERIVYCALLCLAPLSGIGLYALMCFIKDILRKLSRNKLISTALIVFLFFFVFVNQFSGYYFYEKKIYRMIDDGDYRAIKWLMENRGSCNIVMARPRISHAVYPISGNYVITAMLRGDTARMRDTRRFLMSGCGGRGEILEKYGVDYVLVGFRIKCGFLEEIYHQDSNYIYGVS